MLCWEGQRGLELQDGFGDAASRDGCRGAVSGVAVTWSHPSVTLAFLAAGAGYSPTQVNG